MPAPRAAAARAALVAAAAPPALASAARARPVARAQLVSLLGLVSLLAALGLLGACRDLPAPPDAAAPDADGFPFPPPRTDSAARIGSADTLEIATWNIENFPASTGTPAYVADLITSLDLDVIVVQEIASEEAWRELLARLREHDGMLSPHVYSPTEYQKLGVIYRTSLVAPGAMRLLFPSDTYAFPRPPLSLPLAIDDGRHAPLALEIIAVHLKAGVGEQDGERRREAIADLDAYLRAQIDGGGEDEVILAGDYNEVVTTSLGQANLAPILGAPDRYTLRTRLNADRGEISFVPSRRLLDHLTTTGGLTAELSGARVEIPRLDMTYSGYVNYVSDHLPVILVAPLAPR